MTAGRFKTWFSPVGANRRFAPTPETLSWGRSLVFWALMLLMIAAYASPWIVSRGVTLSPNAWDLGEWTSLHPAVRGEDPALLTSLLLRLPLLCLGLMAAFSADGRLKTRRWWFCALFVLGTSVALLPALLPPLDLIQSASGDVNYGQMFNLSVSMLVGGVIGLSGVLGRWQRWFVIVIALAAGVSGIWGLARGYALMEGFNLPVSIGAGGILLAVFCAGMIVFQINKTR